jgi:hypothetical protein
MMFIDYKRLENMVDRMEDVAGSMARSAAIMRSVAAKFEIASEIHEVAAEKVVQVSLSIDGKKVADAIGRGGDGTEGVHARR